MAKRLNKPGKRKRTSYFPVKLPINSLSGGVGRQAPSKRMPNEAEDLDNVFCTAERSIDKRNGFEILTGGEDLFGEEIGAEGLDVWWYWFLAGRERQYLVGIVKNGMAENMLVVYKKEGDALLKQSVDTELDEEIVSYINHGNKSSFEGLRACTVGSSVVLLNTEVKAGFTSDGDNTSLKDLSGIDTGIEDVEGRKIEYLTAVGVDPEGQAEYYNSNTDYVWGQTVIDKEDKVYGPVPWLGPDEDNPDTEQAEVPGQYYIWKVKSTVASGSLPGPNNSAVGDTYPSGSQNASIEYDITGDDYTGSYWYRANKSDVAWSSDDHGIWGADNNADGGTVEGRDYGVFEWKHSKYIPVEDYVYPDPTKLYLGQSVSKLSDLKFPPDETDAIAFNGAVETKAMIKALYPNSGDEDGRGKVYYLSQTYLSSTPGWYRVISSDKSPYLEKVRTPDEMAVIDKNRMPMQIYLNTETNKWSIKKIEWDPRTSGTTKSNPGPSFFKDSDKKAKQVEIKAISYYRDRLFLASEDALVSSKLGDFSNLFLDDPASITFTDPVDLRVSSNVFTPITYLQPFKDFLFLATAGETQYELLGSENQISPLTAELAPTSFFPMTEDVSPLVMNNNLFFFSKQRLFIYFSASQSSGQQAFELSRHVPEYLPETFKTSSVSAAHNMIFAVSGEEPNKIFCYRNLVSGDQIVQNAFFTMTLNEKVSIESVKATEDELLMVIKTTDANGRGISQVQRLSLIPDEASKPRLDSKKNVSPVSVNFDSTSNQTTIVLPYGSAQVNQLVSIAGQHEGEIIDVVVVEGTPTTTTVAASGDYNHLGAVVAGEMFVAKAQLSTIYARDKQNNIIPGPLNLRYLLARHRNTGSYDVKVGRKNRAEKKFSFSHNKVGAVDEVGEAAFFEKDGTFKVPLLGFSDDLTITFESSSPNPMNITNIELAGKFKRLASTLTM